MAYRTRVKFSQVDAGAVLFHARIHELAEEAIEEYYASAGVNLRVLIREFHVGVPVVESRCVYVSPLRYLTEVDIEVGVADLTSRGYRMLYNVHALPERRLAAAGHLRHRFVDTRTFRGTEVSSDILERFRPLIRQDGLVDDARAYRFEGRAAGP